MQRKNNSAKKLIYVRGHHFMTGRRVLLMDSAVLIFHTFRFVFLLVFPRYVS